MTEPEEPERDISAIFKEGTAIDRALRQAFHEAAFRHKQLGVPLIVWQDGHMVSIPPEDIVVPDKDDTTA